MLESTYGWYWAADVLTHLGANVHLAPCDRANLAVMGGTFT
jgi:hypothetical protein